MSLSIVQVATAFNGWGRTELHILELSSSLRRRGHEVLIACRPLSWIQQEAERAGLDTLPINVLHHNDFQNFGALCRHLRARRADVVHVHERHDIVVASLAAMQSRVPVRIMTRHMSHRLNNRIGSRLYSNIFFSRVIAPSLSVKQALIESGMPACRIEIIPIASRLSDLSGDASCAASLRSRLRCSDDDVIIGMVGYLGPGAGYQNFIEAAQRLRDRKERRFLIVGQGPAEAEIQAQIAAAGLADRFLCVPFDEHVESMLGAMDIVVVPPVQPEVVSAILQVAMTLGKAVVATAIGVNCDIIRNDVNGLLTPPGDCEALAAAVGRLASDAPLRARLASEAQADADRGLSSERMMDQIEALYYAAGRRSASRFDGRATRTSHAN